jgi:hypothetical protein
MREADELTVIGYRLFVIGYLTADGGERKDGGWREKAEKLKG